jgi:hypothetical protein
MKAIVLSEYTAENLYQAPEWWVRFTDDILPYDCREKTKKRHRIAAWLRDVNAKLIQHGGRIQRQDDDDYLITFRLDSNYTFFMLKYA